MKIKINKNGITSNAKIRKNFLNVVYKFNLNKTDTNTLHVYEAKRDFKYCCCRTKNNYNKE